MPKNWLEAINALSAYNKPYVMVTLLGTRGSTPRNNGTKMIVSKDTTYDTIGGGHLEHKVTETALKILADEDCQQQVEHYQLGASLGQCCGGSTSVLFERFDAQRINIVLFGAGHVGKALVSILAELPCRIQWIDSRKEQYPSILPNNVQPILSDTPAGEITALIKNSYYIVMTHDHQLDFSICEAILKRNDFEYLGLIGSKAKWQRFYKRFEYKGFDREQVNRINCPAGLNNISGKIPMEIAVSIAGEIINLYQQKQIISKTTANLTWKKLKNVLPDKVLSESSLSEESSIENTITKPEINIE